MPDRVGLYLQDTYSLPETVKIAQYAETRGFDSVWAAEGRFARDPVVTASAFAARTSRIRIGTAVVNIWTRHVVALASTFLSLDDLARDRMICGLGPWWDPLAAQVGIDRAKPLLAMREAVAALRGLLAGEQVTMQGEFVRLNGITLEPGSPLRGARYIPIYIGVTGPRMTALAGEIADGVLLNFMVSPEYNVGVMRQLENGAMQAGRSLDSIERPQLVMCAVDRDRDKALNTARRVVTQYLRQQPRIMLASGVPRELLDEIAQVLPLPFTSQQLDDAMLLVPDDVVQMLVAAGSPDECKAKVRDYTSAGATYPVLVPLGDDVDYLIDVFASGYSS